jgi:phage terminase large subunit-like protein
MSSRRNGKRKQPAEVELFARFCASLILENGKPMRLEAFQRRLLADYFSGIRETLTLIPKKNGKTTLLAALALYHLITTPNAACFVAAASRDQATILYDQARGFRARSPWLQDYVDVKRGYREIRSKVDSGFVRVLAADADTADGVLPTLALVDELHRQKSSELYAVFRDGLGARDGQMVTISTAGDDDTSPLGRLREAAHALPNYRRRAAYRYASTDSFALHEWALEPDDDRDDLKVVKRANPAPWQTEQELRKRRDSPSTRPWEWARFACGVWLVGEESAIGEKEWARCSDPDAEIPAGATDVYIGIDLGWKWDTTAIVPVWDAGEEEPYTVDPPTIITPPQDGTATPEDKILEPLAALHQDFVEATFVLDPEAGGWQLAQRLEQLGYRVAVHSQKPTPMALAAQRLTTAIAKGQGPNGLRHPNHPELNRHVLAAGAKPVGEGFKFVKPRRKRRPIDGVVALAMALSTAVAERQAEPAPIPTIEVWT